MKRGEVWSASGGFAGKPRPWVVIQADHFSDLETAVMCPLTSYQEDYGALRPVIEPDARNGLTAQSFAMVDKIAALAKPRLGRRIGVLSADELSAIDAALLLMLGLAT